MRFSLIIPAVLLLAASHASAQLFTPEVIAGGGDYDNSASIHLSWTLGEPVITTMQDGPLTITQGFHQPTDELMNVAAVPTTGADENTAVLYPNPFRKQLYIRAPQSWTYFDVEIINGLGETVIGREHVDRDKYAIDFSNLPSGSYIVRIWVKDAKVPQTYQVTRIE